MNMNRAFNRPRPSTAAQAATAQQIADIVAKQITERAAVIAADRAAERVAYKAGGFDRLANSCRASRAPSGPGLKADARLTRAPAGVAGEVDPTSGGFLVPTVYVERLVQSIYDEAVIAPLCDRMETDRPFETVFCGVDETSRADGSRWGGAASYWSIEGDTVSPSLPKWRRIEFQAHKLFALCVATSELIADAPMLGAYVRKAFSAEMSFKLDAAIVKGTGAGVPLGVLNSAALITIAKDSGQASATITATNIENAWAALPVPCRRRATWLVNELVEGQLSSVNAPGPTPTQTALYMPQGVGGNEHALLKGRPCDPDRAGLDARQARRHHPRRLHAIRPRRRRDEGERLDGRGL